MAARVIAEAAANPIALEVRSDELSDSLTDSTERRFATKAQQRDLQTLADALIAEAGLAVSRDSDAYRRFCLWLLKAQQTATKTELTLLQGDLGPLPAPIPAQRPTGGSPSAIPLSKVIERYVAFKRAQGAWTAQTDEIHEATYSELVALLGDKPVAEISKADLLRFYEELPKLPTNAAKKWRGMNARQVLDATADMEVPRLSPRSINKRLVMVRSLFGWLERSDLIERDPSVVLQSVPKEATEDDRIPFTDSEVLLLLARCEAEAETAAQRFVPRILAYSGLRLDEAAQLTKADIAQVDGIWCFRVNADADKKIKTRTARRLVPIHSTILGELLAHREARSEGNLWGLTASGRGGHSAALGRWLNRRVRKVTTDTRKVMHSLRHNVATKLKATGTEEYVIEGLLGHTSRSMSTGRYGHDIPPSRMAEIVALITYDAKAKP
jgi:integrase